MGAADAKEAAAQCHVIQFSPTNWVRIEEEVWGGAQRRREDERQNLMMKLMRKCKGGEDRLSLPTFRETRGKEGECVKSREP